MLSFCSKQPSRRGNDFRGLEHPRGAGIRSDPDILQNARNLEEISLIAKTDTESIEINVGLGNGLCP